MKKLTNILEGMLVAFIGLVLFILLLPVIIISTPISFYSDRRRKKESRKYLTELGDKNFFCYNNRVDAKEYIEKELIPKLDKEIELIYLDGQEPRSKYVQKHISLALYNLKNYSGFPHLLKIRNGQVIDQSVNNEFFNTMNQNKPLDKLLKDINDFFELGLNNTDIK